MVFRWSFRPLVLFKIWIIILPFLIPIWEKRLTPIPKFGQRGYPLFPNLVKGVNLISQIWEKMVTSFPKFGLKMVILIFYILKKESRAHSSIL